MKLNINNYPGAKGGSGVTQWIINHIPQFDTYREIFAGSGTIGKTLYTAGLKDIVLHEKSEAVYRQLSEAVAAMKPVPSSLDFCVFDNCGVQCLEGIIAISTLSKRRIFVYADPPYTKSSRRSSRNIYDLEWTDEQHREFLALAVQAKFPMMISHYDDPIYNDALADWKTATFDTMTRKGPAQEKIYMNYDIAQMALPNYEFIGTDFIDRQRISRRKKAYAAKFKKMPFHERQAVLEYIHKSLGLTVK